MSDKMPCGCDTSELDSLFHRAHAPFFFTRDESKPYWPVVPLRLCHITGCDRPALPGFPVCGPCRVSYLNGVGDGARGDTRDRTPCSRCGHFVHAGTACGWHGGSCDEATADSSLWCPCPVR